MERFIKYNAIPYDGMKKPKLIEDKAYFTNGHCIVYTTEGVGNIPTWTEADGNFLTNMEQYFTISNETEKFIINIRDVAAKFKAEGYKFTREGKKACLA